MKIPLFPLPFLIKKKRTNGSYFESVEFDVPIKRFLVGTKQQRSLKLWNAEGEEGGINAIE